MTVGDRQGGAVAPSAGAVPEVCAVVLGSRGGHRLARTLASVVWAGDRVVLDPTSRLAGESLPAGVRRAGRTRPAEVTDAPWLLLLDEDEIVSPALAVAIADTIRAGAPCSGYRVAQEVRELGARLRPRRDLLRLARREGVRLVLERGLLPALSVSGSVGRLEGTLEKEGAESLGEAVDDLSAHADTVAALLNDAGARPAIRTSLVAFAVAGGRVLSARGTVPGRWSRWSLAVLAGFRAMVAYAKLWEFRWTHGAPAP